MTRMLFAALFALSPALATATGAPGDIGTALITLTEAEISAAIRDEAARLCGDASWHVTAEMDAAGLILDQTVAVTCHG